MRIGPQKSKKLKKVITDDGSITFYNPFYEEHYHTKAGAVKEAFVKFVKPCMFSNLAGRNKEITILDICFGLGYNSAAAIKRIRSISDSRIIITGLEIDKRIIKKIKDIKSPFAEYEYIKKASENLKGELSAVDEDGIKIELIIGDARKTIKKISKMYDCVFLDPFSPKKCPELWEYDFIRSIRELCKRPCMMTTYSCSRKARDNMRKAGFIIEDVEPFGRRAPSTAARLI